MMDREMIAAQLTASGRSAVAVIGVDGLDWASGLIGFEPASNTAWRVGQIRYGQWISNSGSESVVVTPTGPMRIEIHCHGGSAAADAILRSLQSAGATIIDGFQWRYRTSGQRSILFHEAEQVLAQCSSIDDAAIVLCQVRGALVDWTQEWIEHIQTNDLDLQSLHDATQQVLNRWTYSQTITRSRRVVLIGPPNVGKSSLVNRLAGVNRSIVHDVAGTTRDVLDGETVIAGIPITLTDTAGVRVADNEIEREGIRRGRLAVGAADLVVIVLDPSTLNQSDQLSRDVEGLSTAPILKVCNKVDSLADQDLPIDQADWILTCAVHHPEAPIFDDGIQTWTLSMAKLLNKDRPSLGLPMPLNQRQFQALCNVAESNHRSSALSSLQTLLRGVC